VKLSSNPAESPLRVFLEQAHSPTWVTLHPAIEASSSWQLSLLTGEFIRWLNEHAPGDRQLEGFEWILDSPNPRTSNSSSKALVPLLRPNFQLFVIDVLILRWENKFDKSRY
jgi:hypothetical protein